MKDNPRELVETTKAIRAGCLFGAIFLPLIAVLLRVVKDLIEEGRPQQVTGLAQGIAWAWLIASVLGLPFAIILITISVTTRLSRIQKTIWIALSLLAIINSWSALKIVVFVLGFSHHD